MASELIVETGAGLPNANTYCSVEECDAYHEDRLYSSGWTAATPDDQDAALIWATRLLDDCVIWQGYKKTQEQSLAWPRGAVQDRDGYNIPIDTIPTFIKRATSELARYLLASDRTAENDITGFRRIKIDVIELQIDKANRSAIIPKSVWTIIRGYGRSTARELTAVRI